MRNIFVLITAIITLSSCSENIVYFEPLVYTDAPEDIYANSAKLGGEILSEGGTDISEYGIVYSKNNPPTINDNKIIVGSRVGIFSDTFNDFLSGTTYYYTVFATNSKGTGYGQVYEFTTEVEAPCNPIENYLDVTSDLSGLSSGYYQSTSGITTNYNEHGADYYLKAVKGSFSNTTEVDIYLDGDISNLHSGVYSTISDLDFSTQIPNKAVVVLKYGQQTFILQDEVVYLKKTGNNVTVTLCNVEFKKNITTTLEATALVNTKYTVTVN